MDEDLTHESEDPSGDAQPLSDDEMAEVDPGPDTGEG
jgi:hypothetical protein